MGNVKGKNLCNTVKNVFYNLHICHHEIVISRSVYDVITENKTKNQKYCNFEFMLERMFELNIYYFEYS